MFSIVLFLYLLGVCVCMCYDLSATDITSFHVLFLSWESLCFHVFLSAGNISVFSPVLFLYPLGVGVCMCYNLSATDITSFPVLFLSWGSLCFRVFLCTENNCVFSHIGVFVF